MTLILTAPTSQWQDTLAAVPSIVSLWADVENGVWGWTDVEIAPQAIMEVDGAWAVDETTTGGVSAILVGDTVVVLDS